MVQWRIELFPFQANKAVWWPESAEEVGHYLNLRRCFLDQGLILDFEVWTEALNSRGEMLECCNSRGKIYGIPWNLWSIPLFAQIGMQYGGLLDISDDTVHCRELSAAILKVRGPEGGFIRRTMQFSLNNSVLHYRVEVISMDVSAYGIFERQSYAQVLINGERRRAGWGNSNMLRCLKDGEDGGRVQNRGCQTVNESPVLIPSPIGLVTDLSPHNQRKEILEQPLESRLGVADCRAGPSSSDSGTILGGKVKTILQRVSPKMVSQFQCMPVQSLSLKSSGEMEGQRVIEGSQEVQSRFGRTYCRRKKLAAQNSLGYRNDFGQNNALLTPLVQRPDVAGVGDDHVEMGYDFDDIDDLGSEADDDCRVSDSLCSIQSEEADPLDDDVAVLAGLRPIQQREGRRLMSTGSR